LHDHAKGRDALKRLIVTADDFGLSLPVNEAVEEAHVRGILTAASLMVTAPAAADAVARARRLPMLGVGLHLVLVHGVPVSAPALIPELLGPDGRFTAEPVRIGIKLFFQRRVQRQVETELRAQLERFRATGLPLDHVDGHHHFHQHPTIVGMLVRFAAEYGVCAVRVPHEPVWPSWRAQRSRLAQRFLGWLFAANRLTGMKRRLRAAGIAFNDHIFGLHDSGRMTPERVDRFLEHLPDGVSELYCHPAARRWSGIDNLPDSYRCVEEYRALADPARRRRLLEAGVQRIPFRALCCAAAGDAPG
jgi:hopanoid biosynthesis associated protein HpnK